MVHRGRLGLTCLALCALAGVAGALPKLSADLSSNPTDSGSYNEGYLNLAWNPRYFTRLSANFAPSSDSEIDGDLGELYANQESRLGVELDAFGLNLGGVPIRLALGAAWYADRIDEKATYVAPTGTFTGVNRESMVSCADAQTIHMLGPRLSAAYSLRALFGVDLDLDLKLAVVPVYYYRYTQEVDYRFTVPADSGDTELSEIPPLSVNMVRNRVGAPIADLDLDFGLFRWFSLGIGYRFQAMPFDFLALESDYSGASPQSANYQLHDLSARAFFEFEAIKGAKLKLGAEFRQSWTLNADYLSDGDDGTEALRESLASWRFLFGFRLE